MNRRPAYVEPTSLAQVIGELGQPDSKVVAGGTALVLMLSQGLIAPERLVSVRRVVDAGFVGVSIADRRVRIGAGTTLAALAASPLVRQHAPSLAHASSLVGNARIRNAATIGGNLAEADYASDPPAVLVALGAVARIDGPSVSRVQPVAELILGHYETTLEPDEVIVAVEVPAEPRRREYYLKFRSRGAEDRPCVGVAGALVGGAEGAVVGGEIVLGAIGGVPQRVDAAFASYAGGAMSAIDPVEVAARVAESCDPMEDHRGSAWYRRQVITALVRRVVAELMRPTP